ncbi:MAG: hypothetical protein O3C43_02205 [Verrucomicrobia bacterium]|nr:hypothetical protein [Verrucomicrobiota bacterium]MDA1065296.1 hypothetical protein [Verrucomicrobiota bacterium]
MPRIKQLIFLLSFLSISVCLFGESLTRSELQERPRVFRGPYNDVVLDNYYYSPAAFLYPGYHSPYYSPLMVFGPLAPGRSSISFSAGSDGYMGTSFQTSQWIPGTEILFSLSSNYEKGELYYSPYDYDISRISPGFSWTNGRTSLFLGFEFSELSLEAKDKKLKARPRVNTGSPLKSPSEESPTVDDLVFDNRSVSVGLSQQIGDHSSIYLSVSDDMFNSHATSLGFSHRMFDASFGTGRIGNGSFGR